MPIRLHLLPHPDHSPHAVQGIEVTADLRRGPSMLTYRVAGALPLFPERAAPERTDELWKRTCFELFVKPAGGEDYFEFNFSPSTQWASYRFDGYRAGMADQPQDAPVIEPIGDGVRVEIDLGGLPEGRWRLAITAVIEETDGTKSYWSAAHPAGKPDFHDPACFALELPAPSGT
jgi:hypothetical protein